MDARCVTLSQHVSSKKLLQKPARLGGNTCTEEALCLKSKSFCFLLFRLVFLGRAMREL